MSEYDKFFERPPVDTMVVDIETLMASELAKQLQSALTKEAWAEVVDIVTVARNQSAAAHQLGDESAAKDYGAIAYSGWWEHELATDKDFHPVQFFSEDYRLFEELARAS